MGEGSSLQETNSSSLKAKQSLSQNRSMLAGRTVALLACCGVALACFFGISESVQGPKVFDAITQEQADISASSASSSENASSFGQDAASGKDESAAQSSSSSSVKEDTSSAESSSGEQASATADASPAREPRAGQDSGGAQEAMSDVQKESPTSERESVSAPAVSALPSAAATAPDSQPAPAPAPEPAAVATPNPEPGPASEAAPAPEPEPTPEPEPAPAPVPATISVYVSVSSDAVGNPVSGGTTVSLPQGATAYDALLASGFAVDSKSTAYGLYVAGIGGLAEKQHGGASGWLYAVNGATPAYSAASYVLGDGDSVSWFYTT